MQALGELHAIFQIIEQMTFFSALIMLKELKRKKRLNVFYAMKLKKHFLLGRKAMTDLDSILKSRDITLLTKGHIVKAMVFAVVMYGCQSWTIKKAEHKRIDAF